jgi:hypothetical protein
MQEQQWRLVATGTEKVLTNPVGHNGGLSPLGRHELVDWAVGLPYAHGIDCHNFLLSTPDEVLLAELNGWATPFAPLPH